MAILPQPVAISIVFGISGLSTAAYLYWDREPEKAQRVVRGIFTFLFRFKLT